MYKTTKVEPSHYKRKTTYLSEVDKYDKIVCLSNIPPPIKLNKTVYIYFHNLLLVTFSLNFSSPYALCLNFLKVQYIKFFNKGSYNWITQTDYSRSLISKKLNINKNLIKLFPFFDISDIPFIEKNFNSNKLNYLCVTSNSKHKNVSRLINAFFKADFSSKKQVNLSITTSGIDQVNDNKKIKYLGYLNRQELIKKYTQSQYIVFPSMIESFGLPIIEGIKSGSNVLISNIKSLKEICKPSIVFDPLDEKDIIKAFETASDMSYQQNSMITIKNEINTFIKLIINDV